MFPAYFFLVISFYFILPGQRSRPFVVALAHTISMCFHQLSVFFFPVAVAGIFLQTASLPTRQRLLKIIEYSGTSFLVTFGIYCLSFYLQTGSLDFGKLVVWLTHFSPEIGFVFNIKESLIHTFRGEIKLFFEGRFNFLKEIVNPFTIFLIVVLLTALVGLVVQIYQIWRDRRIEKLGNSNIEFRSLTLLCVVWASTYLIFLFFWIPMNTFYRMFYLPSFIILIGILLCRHDLPEKRKWLAPSFVVVMAVSNFLFFIYPYSHVRKVTPLELALNMNSIWSKGSVIYYSRMESDNQLIKYFNPYTSWKRVEETEIDDLESEMRTIYEQGGDVWMETTAFEEFSRSDAGTEWLNIHRDKRSTFKLDDPAYNVILIKIVP